MVKTNRQICERKGRGLAWMSSPAIPDFLVAKPGIWMLDYRGEKENWSGIYLIGG